MNKEIVSFLSENEHAIVILLSKVINKQMHKLVTIFLFEALTIKLMC